MVPFPEPCVVGAAKGCPDLVTRDGGIRGSQHRQALPQGILLPVIPAGPENRHSFLGLLSLSSPETPPAHAPPHRHATPVARDSASVARNVSSCRTRAAAHCPQP